MMSAMAPQITGVTIIYPIVCSGTDERKHQSFASLAFVRGVHLWPMNWPHKTPVTRKRFPFVDVIMICQIVGYHIRGKWLIHDPKHHKDNKSQNLEHDTYNQTAASQTIIPPKLVTWNTIECRYTATKYYPHRWDGSGRTQIRFWYHKSHHHNSRSKARCWASLRVFGRKLTVL